MQFRTNVFPRIHGSWTKGLVLLCAVTLSWSTLGRAEDEDPPPSPPFLANGVKIGEVDRDSAILWTRLTAAPERNKSGVPITREPKVPDPNDPTNTVRPDFSIPEGTTLADMDGAVPGFPGEVRLSYWEVHDASNPIRTGWTRVVPERDFTHQFELKDLTPSTEYAFKVKCRNLERGPFRPAVEGEFRTAPLPDDATKVVFTVITGQQYEDRDSDDGHKIYTAMAALEPNFFVHTGDIVYLQSHWVEYDGPGEAVDRARYQWNRNYGLPLQIQFHRFVPSYFIKDDHDIGKDDCYPGREMEGLTYQQGIALFREQNPVGVVPYRTLRWGKDLQIWLVEGRDFRSPNTDPDGPEKTIWGAEQKAWLKRTVLESDAPFKLLISPTPIVGPDRGKKQDNHSNSSWSHEGNEIREWIRDHAPDLMIICGDRHWQYVSVDPRTGVREYSCGPASDEHAGGWSEGLVKEYHRYLNVVGGFLSGTVERVEGKPTLALRHHDVSGKVLNEDRHAR